MPTDEQVTPVRKEGSKKKKSKDGQGQMMTQSEVEPTDFQITIPPRKADLKSLILQKEKFLGDMSVDRMLQLLKEHVHTKRTIPVEYFGRPESKRDEWGMIERPFTAEQGMALMGLNDLLPPGVKDKPENFHPVVAILSTGINADHEAFKGKVIAQKDFTKEADSDVAVDEHGHGTFCAGIVAGSTFEADNIRALGKNSPKIHGVYPEAKLVVAKVVGEDGGRDEWIADALDWISGELAGTDKAVDIIILSISGDSFSLKVHAALSRCILKGIIPVAAASNDGKKSRYSIGYPARHGDVLCVGAHGALGHPTDYTSVGREIDFTAFGGTYDKPVWAASHEGTTKGTWMVGTSNAAPYVAGIICWVLYYAEAYQVRRFCMHVCVMRELLREMSGTTGHHDDESGYGTLYAPYLLNYGPDHFRMKLAYVYFGDKLWHPR